MAPPPMTGLRFNKEKITMEKRHRRVERHWRRDRKGFWCGGASIVANYHRLHQGLLSITHFTDWP
jgi:hypothetical protein